MTTDRIRWTIYEAYRIFKGNLDEAVKRNEITTEQYDQFIKEWAELYGF